MQIGGTLLVISDIRNALFKNGTQFINVSKDVASIVLPVSIDIKDNRFELFRAGAISCFAAKFQSASIKNNIILDNLDDLMAGQTRIGIKWANNTMVGFNKAQIQDNTVHDNLKTQPVGISELWQHYGISVNGSSNTKIESNLLFQNYQISEDRIYEGIRLFVSPFNDVVNNHVLSTGPSQGPFAEFSNFKGILSRESGNTLISCNVVDGLNHGLSFFGPTCDKTQLKSNIVKSNNKMGLYLASGSIIGQQPKRHNAWPGNGNTEALFDGDPAQGALLTSPFILSTSNMNSAVWPNPRFPAVGWFVAPQAETPIPPYDLCYRDPSPPRSEADRQAINGEFQACKGYPASLWEVQLSAFGTLAAHLELLTTGSADLQFYNAHDASNLGKLSRAIKVWESIAQFGTSLESTWNINQTSTNQKLEEIREKAIEMSQAQTLTQQEQIALEIASLESTLLALQETNQALSAQYQSGVNTNATQLLGSLVNITPTEIWETNLKTVLTLLAQNTLAGNSSWITTDQNTLQAIADQCRFAGGIGVVLARAAINKSDYVDEVMCPGYAERTSQILTLPAKLMPNPASDICYIAFDQQTTATLLVSDLQGHLLKTLKVKEVYSLVLDTQDLANGLYAISIKDARGHQFFGKLAIVH